MDSDCCRKQCRSAAFMDLANFGTLRTLHEARWSLAHDGHNLSLLIGAKVVIGMAGRPDEAVAVPKDLFRKILAP